MPLLHDFSVVPQEGSKSSDEENGIGRWIKKQLNNPRFALCGWNKGEIREAIDRLKRAALLSASLILLGENSAGKTSLAMTSLCT